MKKFKKGLGIFAMLLGLSLTLIACSAHKRDLRSKPYVKEVFTMGTYIKITSMIKVMKKTSLQHLQLRKIMIRKPRLINLVAS